MDNTTIQALQNLYVEMGGNADDVENITTIPEMINAVKSMTKPFIITMTQTSDDYSGTMDKTPEEIWEAYKAHRRIAFSIPAMRAYGYATQMQEHDVDEDGVSDCVNVSANITYEDSGVPVLIWVITSTEDSSYSTTIFPLSTT